THKPNDPWSIADKIPWLFNHAIVLIQQHHIDEHITGIKFSGAHRLFAAAHFGHFFHRHEHLFDVLAHFFGLEALFNALFDLLLLAGKRMNDKPLVLHLHAISFQSASSILRRTPAPHRPPP